MRTAIIGIVAAALGALAGGLVAQQRLSARLATSETDRETLGARVQGLEQDCKQARDQTGLLEARLAGLTEENEGLLEQLAALEAEPQGLDVVEPVGPETEPLEATLEAALAERRPRRRGRWGDGSSTPEERAEREERIREYVAQARERTNNFFADQLEQAQDPAARERLGAISDYYDYMLDLNRQMREAGTEEDREALAQEMHEARDVYRRMVGEQQEQMVRDIIANSGVTNPQKQDELIKAVKEQNNGALVGAD